MSNIISTDLFHCRQQSDFFSCFWHLMFLLFYLQVISGEDLCPVHGPPQSWHRGEDEVSLLSLCLLGHKCCQVSTPAIFTLIWNPSPFILLLTFESCLTISSFEEYLNIMWHFFQSSKWDVEVSEHAQRPCERAPRSSQASSGASNCPQTHACM